MKKRMGILSLILFIILVFGITISIGADDTTYFSFKEYTTAQDMIDALNRGESIEDITYESKAKNENDGILCVQRYRPLYPDAIYQKNGTVVNLPKDDKVNGYAKAYILAAPGYVMEDSTPGDVTPSDERQYAWHFITGEKKDGETANDLYNIALDYQNYKKNEVDMDVTKPSNDVTTIVGNNAIYGPIKIAYSYGTSESGKKTDEWGGFYYAFFDEDGSNITNKVKLCTLSNGTYTPITATLITSGDKKGYYQIKTDTYNNKKLYAVTSDFTIGNVSLKIRNNSVKYSAELHQITGIAEKTADFKVLCSSCWKKVNSATTSIADAKASSALLKYGDKYYMYEKTEYAYRYNNAASGSTNYYQVGTNIINIPGETVTVYTQTNYCSAANGYGCTTTHTIGAYMYPDDSPGEKCSCGETWKIGEGTPSAHGSGHHTTQYRYTVKKYVFEEQEIPCELKASDKGGWCTGATGPGRFPSQTLEIVKTASEYDSKEVDIGIEFLTSVDVKKVWLDNNNSYGTRPAEITVKLLADNVDTGKTLKLNANNNWSATFEELRITDDKGNDIKYTVQEVTDVTKYRYEQKGITGSKENGYTITNMLKTEVAVQKVWEDQEDLDEFRPKSIEVELLANNVATGKKLTLNVNNNWSATFTNLDKCDANGNVIVYTVKEFTINKYTVSGETDYVDDPSTGLVAVTITNTHTPSYEGYIEIKGTVWCDEENENEKGNDGNGIYGSEDTPLEGITVILRDAEGDYFNTNNKTDGTTSTTVTNKNGQYTIKVNVDTTKDVYKLHQNPAGGDGYETLEERLAGAYVEFVYDANKYTTINYASSPNAKSSANLSKAKENESARNTFDNNYSVYPKGGESVDQTITACNNEKITASTEGIILFGEYLDKVENQTRTITLKYGYGDRYIRTNPDGAWNKILDGTHEDLKTKTGKLKTYDVNVTVLQNVNLGLLRREQPDAALHSYIRKVDVEINNQRYTYMYNIDTNTYKDATDITAKFQNEEDYTTYMFPVNPADVASLNEGNTTMDVYVTYEIAVANLSNTLTITVDEINNNYDANYQIDSIIYGVMNKTTGQMEKVIKNLSIPTATSTRGYNEITLSNLGITVKEDEDELEEKIYIRYRINKDQISRLFAEEAPLNNASEIIKYSIQYGEDTLYAEKRKNSEVEESKKREAYGGYDYNSTPGNAGFYMVESTESAERRIKLTKDENDDDVAEAFVLCKDKDNSKTLSGTVWEDTDVITNDKERLGNGKDDGLDNEMRVQNVKVELYEIKTDKNGVTSVNIANLYNEDTERFEKAVVYTDANGGYALKGVVTGEYFIKYTYGDDTSELEKGATTMDGGNTTVNARNYKSTIITDSTIEGILSKDYAVFSEEEKMWHITHKDGYSVAVDNMLDRLDIPDLQYSNFRDDYTEPQNMTAYTKPFKTLVEFETTGMSQVDQNGNIVDENGQLVEGINNLDKLDFGIIERPREDLFVEKTVTYFKLQLANGQILTEGNPGTQKMNYVKAMGINQEVKTGAEARAILPRRLLTEVDSELIQGAEIKIDYLVKVTNNNEVDYDYGVTEDYTDIIKNVEVGQSDKYDKYITKNLNAKYYYYGNHDGLNPAKAEIKFIDYIDKDLVYQEDTSKWVDANFTELKDFINPQAAELVDDTNNSNVYKALVSATEPKLILASGEHSNERSMTATKVLTNESENTYDNGLEIIRIDGKTARTIQESKNGEQIQKTYKPGNYIPGSSSGSEQDDDKVDVLVTPPTGLTTNYMAYIITGLVGLIVMVVAIVVIKKKVIIK